MDWLNMLKTIQKTPPDTISSFPITLHDELPKLSKDIVTGFLDQLPADGESPRPDTVSAYCESYGGHCSVKVTGSFPDDCHRIKCEYLTPPEVYPRGHIWHNWHLAPIPAATTGGNKCRCCKGTDFWLSAITENHWTCRKCHPPMDKAERMEVTND